MANISSEIYTVHEAARILKVTYTTALRYIHDGKLKVINGGGGSKGKRGDSYMILKEDLDKFRIEYPPKKTGRHTGIKLTDEKSVMKRIMQKNGYSFKQLTDEMGFHYTTVMSVINGKAAVTKEFSKKFADIFGIDVTLLDKCISEGAMPECYQSAEEAEETMEPAPASFEKEKPVPYIISKEATNISDVGAQQECKVNPKVYYVITCYVRTKDGLVFDNVGYNLRRTNLGTKKIFTTKSAAESYLLDVIHAKRDEKNNSGCFYKVTVNEAELVAYKTVYDICEVEVEE